RNTDPIVVMGGSEDPCNEHQSNDDVEPFFHHFAVGPGKSDQQVGEDSGLDHFPDALDPKMNRPPSIEDADRVVVPRRQSGQVEECSETETSDKNALRGGPTSRLL